MFMAFMSGSRETSYVNPDELPSDEHYDALSYVWGSDDKPNTLNMLDDETKLPITNSLYRALQRFRRTDKRRNLWVDAVCINQADNVEKSVQVAMMGRIYLPVNELQQFDVKAHELLNRVHSERFVALMKFQAARAHQTYDDALALLPQADRRNQKPGLMMASIYRTLLREIERDDFKVLDQRVSLTPVRKLWLAWRVQALGRL